MSETKSTFLLLPGGCLLDVDFGPLPSPDERKERDIQVRAELEKAFAEQKSGQTGILLWRGITLQLGKKSDQVFQIPKLVTPPPLKEPNLITTEHVYFLPPTYPVLVQQESRAVRYTSAATKKPPDDLPSLDSVD